MESTSLRRATDADLAFLQSVYASTRMEELEVTGWSNEQKNEFCLSQFRAQDAHYRVHFPAAEYHVVQSEGHDVGRLSVDHRMDELHLIDLAILPDFRGKGIGTTLLKDFQRQAAAANIPLTIYVERYNPALRLYQRLGFQQVQDEGIYLLMKWEAA